MGDVFDRWRLNQGWNPWDNQTQDMAIASWVHSLDREGIPATAYGELYERVLTRRADAITHGRQVPTFGVELLIAEWNGEWGLRNQLRQREIDAGHTLGANAESVCQHCFGSGWRDHVISGYKVGKRRCDHGE